MTMLVEHIQILVQRRYGQTSTPLMLARMLLVANHSFILETKSETAHYFMDVITNRKAAGTVCRWIEPNETLTRERYR
jgi:hypothetical protein